MPPDAPPPAPQPDAATLQGAVERVVFHNPETGWTVVRLRPAEGGAEATVVGALVGAQPGQTLRFTGEWVVDRRYGRQFRAASVSHVAPATVEGIRRYLGSGLVPGIGEVIAERLVRRFGLLTLEVIDREPERLAEVAGIGPVRSRRIRAAWGEHRDLREVMVFLQGQGITAGQAIRIYKRYGGAAIPVIRDDPYRLASEIIGIGFLTADRIAGRLGVPRDAPQRAAAGLLYALGRAAEGGHVYLPRARLLAEGERLLALSAEALAAALDGLIATGRAVAETAASGAETAIYLPDLHAAERALADGLARLLRGGAAREAAAADEQDAVARLEAREGLELAREQRQAVREALSAPALVITGGPGTGKTTLIRSVARILAARGRRLLLAAPTGRAAKRLGEASGVEARTVHRLLEFDPAARAFKRGRERPLEADAVIVDEVSMLDVPLAASLVDAMPEGGRLILVGDADQLPSVGPGRVLDDLVAGGRLPVIRLTRIFRQAAASLIVRNAHRIRDGELPELDSAGAGSDFFFIAREEPEAILATLRQLVTERIPRGFGLDPRRDIQVLTPMRRGLLGTESLNRELQDLLNPAGEPLPIGGGFRAGDRVMQIRNDYDLDVFNGDIGTLRGFDEGTQRAAVEIDGRTVLYERTDLDALALAYACSIHKAQGSEYPCVVLPLHTQHRMLLERNLLYTAVTRARRLLVLVGSRRAVALAVRTGRREERYSGLARRLQQAL